MSALSDAPSSQAMTDHHSKLDDRCHCWDPDQRALSWTPAALSGPGSGHACSGGTVPVAPSCPWEALWRWPQTIWMLSMPSSLIQAAIDVTGLTFPAFALQSEVGVSSLSVWDWELEQGSGDKLGARVRLGHGFQSHKNLSECGRQRKM